jgi:hypothetical protein
MKARTLGNYKTILLEFFIMNIALNLTQSTLKQSIPLSVIEYMILYDGETFYTVQKDFYDAIRHQVADIIHLLNPGEKYTLEMLCGPDFWNPLGEGKQRMAGRCMVDIVRNGLLPLSFAESQHEFPKYYQLA